MGINNQYFLHLQTVIQAGKQIYFNHKNSIINCK